MKPYKVSSGSGVRGIGRFSQSGGYGKNPARYFLGLGWGQTWYQQNPKQSSNSVDSVGSSIEVSQSTVLSIIANQTPF